MANRFCVNLTHAKDNPDKIYACSPCFKKRKLDENNLVSGATIVGGVKLVEFLSEGSPCVSY